MSRLRDVPARSGAAVGAVLIALVRVYQYVLSPMFGQRCRFYPSCSNYAIEALRLHGPVRGTGLATWRVLRCNPFSHGGVDPVPPRRGRARTPLPVESEVGR